jgi:hypothetical protein
MKNTSHVTGQRMVNVTTLLENTMFLVENQPNLNYVQFSMIFGTPRDESS